MVKAADSYSVNVGSIPTGATITKEEIQMMC